MEAQAIGEHVEGAARGLSEAEAQSLIVKGFLSLDILGLPESLRKDVDKMIEESTAAGAM